MPTAGWGLTECVILKWQGHPLFKPKVTIVVRTSATHLEKNNAQFVRRLEIDIDCAKGLTNPTRRR